MTTPAWRRYRFLGSNVRASTKSSVPSRDACRRIHRAWNVTRRGAPPAERRFGDEQKARAECVSIDENAARAMSRGASIASLSQDVRYAARLLRRQAATASLAVLCLALGIGATTAMFSVADALLIRPLPFATGDHLFLVATTRDPGRDADVSSYPDYLDWRARQHSFSELAAFGQTASRVVLARPVRAAAPLSSPRTSSARSAWFPSGDACSRTARTRWRDRRSPSCHTGSPNARWAESIAPWDRRCRFAEFRVRSSA
jgi:hypothetical protein